MVVGGINMSDLFTVLKEKVTGQNLRIVFPEGQDERILAAKREIGR